MSQEIIPPLKNALVVTEIKNPAEVFVQNGLDQLISKIAADARKRAAELDISTEKNRKALISLSVEVRDAKVLVEEMRVQLVADEKKRLKIVDAEGARAWGELEALQKEIRKPVTDWEQAEEARIKGHNDAMQAISNMALLADQNILPADILARMDLIDKEFNGRQWQEFLTPAGKAAKEAGAFLNNLHARRVKEIADAAELQRLRDEQAARDKKEREDKIAADAAAEATRKAEERALLELKAQREKAAQEKAHAEAQIKAQQEALDKAARDKAAAEQKAIDDAAAAAKALKDQEQRAEEEKAALLKKQRDDAIAAKKKLEDEAAQRRANEDHAHKINNEVLAAMMASVQVADYPDMFKGIIVAIRDGKIPHVKITY